MLMALDAVMVSDEDGILYGVLACIYHAWLGACMVDGAIMVENDREVFKMWKTRGEGKQEGKEKYP